MRLATCLLAAALCSPSAMLAQDADRGMVMERLNKAFVIDPVAPSFVGIVPLGGQIAGRDCVVAPDGQWGFASDFSHHVWVIYLAGTPPLNAGPIDITPRGLDLASTRDGRFIVACGDFSSNLVSVVDTNAWAEYTTFDLQGECSAVDVCRDGSVLVSSVNTGLVRRLVIDAAGNLTDTGESFPVLAAGNVYCSPDGHSGVAFDNWFHTMISFRTQGMIPVSERTLPTYGVAGVMAKDGSRFYARTHSATVEAYAYNQASAVLGEAPSYSLDLYSGGWSGLTLDPQGSNLYVPQNYVVRIIDAESGIGDQYIFDEALLYPSGICFRPFADAGCVAGDPCDDGNPCTDDTCDSGTGTCAHVTNDSNPCSDNDACTQSDVCRSGLCIGMDPVACDDPCGGGCCTVSECDPTTGGCAGVPRDCDDRNPCTDDSCDDSSGECVHAPSYAYTDCDDHDICDGVEYCDGYGYCISIYPPQCDDFVVCTIDSCDPVVGCMNLPAPSGTSCDPDGDPCNGQRICDENLNCGPTPAPNCDDGNPCTSDACVPGVGCVHTDEPEGTPCDDGLFCNGYEYCHVGGSCYTEVPYVCFPSFNPCAFELCDEQTGCYAYFQPAGTPCSDGNLCNGDEVCDGAFACLPGAPVVCGALDQCHAAGACDPASGLCSNPAQPDGTTCNDGNVCTAGETCMAGACTPASSGSNEPNPRTNGYYKRLCHGPHSGDELTDADAACVASVAHTFAGVSTVADLCSELTPSQPNNDPCDRSDDDLMVLALNICRARVCTAQSIDSQCGGNANVGQSLAESDAILSSPSRDGDSCDHAKCLDEEINTGRALELNTLVLRLEGIGVRLDWHPPYLDDGSAHPTAYHVWRRSLGSLAPFVQIGVVTEPTFLDAAAIGAYQYEVTAVMN